MIFKKKIFSKFKFKINIQVYKNVIKISKYLILSRNFYILIYIIYFITEEL